MLPVVGDSWNLLGSGDPSHNVWCAVESHVYVFRVLGEWDVAGEERLGDSDDVCRAGLDPRHHRGLLYRPRRRGPGRQQQRRNWHQRGSGPDPAREVFESRQGYGWASRRGLAEATGSAVLAEPDGTFLPRDIGKLLAYSDECEAVFGTRTTRSLIWSGANMGLLLKWGNWAVAKLVEALFNTSHLSDVGCTYKLLHRSLAQRLLPELRWAARTSVPS